MQKPCKITNDMSKRTWVQGCSRHLGRTVQSVHRKWNRSNSRWDVQNYSLSSVEGGQTCKIFCWSACRDITGSQIAANEVNIREKKTCFPCQEESFCTSAKRKKTNWRSSYEGSGAVKYISHYLWVRVGVRVNKQALENSSLLHVCIQLRPQL